MTPLSRVIGFLPVLVISLIPANSNGSDGPDGTTNRKVPIYAGLGNYSRTVATDSEQAQAYFDQGLNFMFAYNHDQAVRSFQAATEADPTCAMAYWGIALASGTNYNDPRFPEAKAKLAWDSLQKAKENGKRETAANRALIEALAARYAHPLPKEIAELEQGYAKAMEKVWQEFPKDADIGALYAESMMNLRPWELWGSDGKPAPDTLKIIDTLEAVRKLNPKHPLACHLLIHAVEASPNPEKADEAANELRDAHPGLGHLQHMPSHIDIRRGRWQDAIEANRLAIKADIAYQKQAPEQGVYQVYMSHNHHMLAFAAIMQGQSQLATDTINEMVQLIPEGWLENPENAAMVDGYMSMPLEVMKRFGQWDKILEAPEMPKKFPFARAMRHYARGVAYAAKGKTEEARQSQNEFQQAGQLVDPEAVFGNNKVHSLLALAGDMLEGEIALREGKTQAGMAALEAAVAKEDALRYTEPPDWIVPVRHALGAFLLHHDKPAEAEAVYREDLRRWPHNGWSLYGLAESLEAQGKKAEAEKVRRQFAEVWKRADVKIPSSCYCVVK